MSKKLPSVLFRQLAKLYADMQTAYREVADAVGLDCAGCEDNCCHSYFQHHTNIEWAYLHKGLNTLPPAQKNMFLERAEKYVADARQALGAGRKPDMICPLNVDGLCGLYEYRLMICRLHGVPNILRPPRALPIAFPGCFKSQALAQQKELPTLDRTPLYTRLVRLEMEFCGKSRPKKVDLTLAEMLVMGPPTL